MKINCENIVRCANRSCYNNCDGYYCTRTVIALNAEGKCALYRPNHLATTKQNDEISLPKLIPLTK